MLTVLAHRTYDRFYGQFDRSHREKIMSKKSEKIISYKGFDKDTISSKDQAVLLMITMCGVGPSILFSAQAFFTNSSVPKYTSQ